LAYGPLSDRFGRRPVVLGGIALFVLGSIGCAGAQSIDGLIGWRIVQALGACGGPVMGRAMVRDLLPVERSARVLALVGTITALAPAVAPTLGGWLHQAFGWRSIFVALGGFGVLVALATAWMIPETNRRLDPSATQPVTMLRNYIALLRDRRFLSYAAVASAAYGAIFVFLSNAAFLLIDWFHVPTHWFGPLFAIIVMGFMSGSIATRYTMPVLGMNGTIRLGQAMTLAAGGTMALIAWTDPVGGWGLGALSVLLPMAVVTASAGLSMPNAMAGAIGPFPHMAGTASALLGFLQMAVSAGLGAIVARLSSGDARALSLSLLVIGGGGAWLFNTLSKTKS